MDELTAYLLQFGSLNPRQLALIASKTTALSLPKDAYFLEAGHISRRVGFLLEGVLRICYYDNKGAEITRNFIDELHLTTNLRGLEDGLASAEYVQAVTDCRLLVFAKHDWDELAHTIVGWRDMVHQMTSQHLHEKLARISPMVVQDATTRYTTGQPDSAVLSGLLSGHHQVVAQPDTEKYPLTRFLPNGN
jgi:CRP-like cAMP-binding protein